MKKVIAIFVVLLLTISTAIAEIDFTNMTAEEILQVINQAYDQLNILRASPSESTEKLVYSGTKTKIISGVTVDFSPCRVTFIQDGNTSYSVSYLRGDSSGTLVNEFKGNKSVVLLNKDGDYEFSIEASSPWTLEIEPLATAGALELSGHGDYVSDIYTIHGSTIIDIEAKYYEFDNCIIHVYTLGKYGWSSNGLTNGLQSSGTESFEKIIKASGETLLFFTIDFDNGDWSIKPSAE